MLSCRGPLGPWAHPRTLRECELTISSKHVQKYSGTFLSLSLFSCTQVLLPVRFISLAGSLYFFSCSYSVRAKFRHLSTRTHRGSLSKIRVLFSPFNALLVLLLCSLLTLAEIFEAQASTNFRRVYPPFVIDHGLHLYHRLDAQLTKVVTTTFTFSRNLDQTPSFAQRSLLLRALHLQ